MTNAPFFITKAILKEMITHCQNELPFEGCGLLSGKNGIATSIWPMENISYSPNSYSMDLKQIEEVFDLINKQNEKLVGIYHSHPTDRAYPSPEDITYNNYPEIAHIIISFARSSTQPDVSCFYLRGTRVIPLKVEKIKEYNI
ncbi:M67 family metallopeptidase [Neobacillus mesonae]|uniref:Mov34/MPN/PAD-1 family protein n=1 Tax=Neobacillus mesonae TaxID=1193713 RepID=UPI002040363C|nr:M67 family metallopeptidase [Neobacillus mesonae]MCM3568572.1 M67 family metallopeptidase [Neobacillus mesonae]